MFGGVTSRLNRIGTIVGLIALVAACTPAASSAPTGPANTGAPSSGPSAVAHAPVTISVGVLRPGATQEAVDALNLQIS